MTDIQIRRNRAPAPQRETRRELGRRIIVENHEALEMLAAYDRGEQVGDCREPASDTRREEARD